jgi:hypothetical protein
MSPTATAKAMARETANLEIPGLNKPLSAPDDTITGVENTMLGYDQKCSNSLVLGGSKTPVLSLKGTVVLWLAFYHQVLRSRQIHVSPSNLLSKSTSP